MKNNKIISAVTISSIAFNIISGTVVFAKDNYEIKNGVLIKAYNLSGEVTLPSDITSIADEAFDDSCNGIIKLIVSGNVKNIGKKAINNIDNLKEVVLQDGVEIIGDKAFYGCNNLKKVILPNSLKKIGKQAFNQSTKLIADGDNAQKVIDNYNGTFDLKAHKSENESEKQTNPILESSASGWINFKGIKSYKKQDGTAQTGWMDFGGQTYYFYSDGILATEFFKLSSTAYYYSDPTSGALVTGWQYINNNWYYFNPQASSDKAKGWMQTGWKYLDGKWYFFYSDGTMATGFINPFGDEYYYLEENTSSNLGALKTGWQNIKGYWYYFDNGFNGSIGLMSKGWKNIEGKWFYFYYGDGKMAVNTWIDGYHINSAGVWDK